MEHPGSSIRRKLYTIQGWTGPVHYMILHEEPATLGIVAEGNYIIAFCEQEQVHRVL